MSRILCTGVATLDIINTVPHYPAEDEELRATAQARRRGGNAANTAAVLAQFRHEVELLATLADDGEAGWLRRQLEREGVGIRYCPVCAGTSPTSYVTHNARNGSRTIIHYRDLPELAPEHLDAVPLSVFDWFHFEGRNVETTVAMLERVRAQRVDQGISLEIEKARPGIEALFGLVDVLIFSRAYAASLGADDPERFLRAAREWAPQAALLVLTSGEAGAWGLPQSSSTVLDAAAYVCGPTLDTLGAGDTFNAGLLHALVSGRDFGEALAFGCRLAGRKVTQTGFANLAAQERL